MLRKFRIEVEEDSAEAAVEALTKYEHALQVAEASRCGFSDKRPTSLGAPDEPIWDPWPYDATARSYFNGQLGREITEEVIEFDLSLPGYKARRVVRFTRADRVTVERPEG